MTHILHIDTSGAIGLVMVATDGKRVATRYNETERDHAGAINRMITAVLADAGLELKDLSAVAICSGPGSYTGLRIGMATAKGLAYAMDLPVIAHNKLELILPGTEEYLARPSISILPARAGEYFILNQTLYEKNAPVLLETGDVNKLILENKDAYIAGKIDTDINLPFATDYIARESVNKDLWCAYSFNSWEGNKFENLAFLEPLYVKSVFIHGKSTS